MLAKGLKIFAVLLAATCIVSLFAVVRGDRREELDPMALLADSARMVVRINDAASFVATIEARRAYDPLRALVFDTTRFPGFLPAAAQERAKTAYLAAYADGSMAFLLQYSTPDEARLQAQAAQDNLPGASQGKENGNPYTTSAVGATLSEADGFVLLTSTLARHTALMRRVARLSEGAAVVETGPVGLGRMTTTDAAANIFIDVPQRKTDIFPFVNDPGWAALDLWIKDDALIINGLSAGQDPDGALRGIVSKKPRPSTVEAMLPVSTAAFYELNDDSLASRQRKASDTEFERRFGATPAGFMNEIYAGAAARITDQSGVVAVGVRVKGQSTCEFVLRKMVQAAAANGDTTAREHAYDFDAQTHFAIYTAQWGDPAGLVLGKPFALPGTRHMTVIDDYLIATDDIDLACKMINASVRQQTLATSLRHQHIRDHQASTANMTFYQRKAAQNDIFASMLPAVVAQAISQVLTETDYRILWQISTEIQRPYHNLVVSLGSGKSTSSASEYEWRSRLTGTAAMKPAIVTNHKSGESEIFVQDDQNIAYLVNRQGRIVWQKQLDGPIISEIRQVDRYKNGFLQLLFNTRGRLYLVDRNGNDTDNYPLELSTPASAGLGLFDYEKNKSYRIALPHVDGKVSMLDIEGHRVEGWVFKGCDAPATVAPQHFRVGDKDFVLLADSLRVYILDRKGDHRVTPSKLVGKSGHNPFYYSVSRQKWFTSTCDGLLMSISLDGQVRTERIFDCGPQHFYMYADLANDGKGCHIFVDGDRLMVANSLGTKLFEHTFKSTVSDPPSFYRFSGKKCGLGIVDRGDGKVFLFDHKGAQPQQFPQHGITPFTITRYPGEEAYHLLVGHTDGNIYDIKID